MLSRYILIFLGVISLLWIGYVGINLIYLNEEFGPKSYFGKEDQKILIVNRIDEFNFQNTIVSIPNNVLDIFTKLKLSLQKGCAIYFSENQSHFLIQKTDKWTKDQIIKLFEKSNLAIDFSGRFTFNVQDFKCEFHGLFLHFYKSGVQFANEVNSNWLEFDHKASAAIIKFNENSNVYSINEIYYKKDGLVEYVSKRNGKITGKQVDDEDLFSSALPEKIKSYHFYEKEYYTTKDKIYKNGPMHYWIESGFVEIELNNEKILITDFTDEKDPFLLLNEIYQEENNTSEESSTYFKNIRLTKDFPINKEKGFYMYKMENLIIISESKAICNEVLMNSNNTTSTQDTLNFYLNELPRKVSERSISTKSKYTKSIYKNKIIETFLK
jgi:hypothetical protein